MRRLIIEIPEKGGVRIDADNLSQTEIFGLLHMAEAYFRLRYLNEIRMQWKGEGMPPADQRENAKPKEGDENERQGNL